MATSTHTQIIKSETRPALVEVIIEYRTRIALAEADKRRAREAAIEAENARLRAPRLSPEFDALRDNHVFGSEFR